MRANTKRLFTVAVFFTLLLGSFFTFANGTKKIKIAENVSESTHEASRDFKAVAFTVKDKTGVRVNYVNEMNTSVKISILDEKGNLVFSDKQRKAYGHLKYDLSNLELGEYQMEIVSGDVKRVHDITIEAEPSKMMAQISEVLEKRDAIRVVYAQADYAVKIAVKNEAGEIVFMENYYYPMDQNLVYIPANDLPEGDYLVTVTDQDKSYFRTVTVTQ